MRISFLSHEEVSALSFDEILQELEKTDTEFSKYQLRLMEDLVGALIAKGLFLREELHHPVKTLIDYRYELRRRLVDARCERNRQKEGESDGL